MEVSLNRRTFLWRAASSLFLARGLPALLARASVGISPLPVQAQGTRVLELTPVDCDTSIANCALATFETPFPFHAAGLLWNGATPRLQFRARADGQDWRPWTDVRVEEHAPLASGASASGLLTVPSVSFAQVRVSPDVTSALPAGLRIVAIDASAGPSPAPQVIAAQTGTPRIISRAEWGADPQLMTYRPEYASVSKFIVHHTVTSDGGADPAATIRAIYSYHAVTLGWGDIGYNYLIDRGGNVYEGRAGGPNSIGIHAGQFNRGSDGIALLGNFMEQSPSRPMLDGLVSIIAWRARTQGVNPQGSSFFVDRNLPNVCSHRDVMATECPGDAAYSLLSAVRERAVTLSAGATPAIDVLATGFSPSSLGVGEAVRVDVTLRNTGSTAVSTQGPEPGVTYREGETFRSVGHPEQPGRVRIAVHESGAEGEDHRFRWGLGGELAPGETRSITGYIRFDSPGTRVLSVGVVQEATGWIQRGLGESTIAVRQPGLGGLVGRLLP